MRIKSLMLMLAATSVMAVFAAPSVVIKGTIETANGKQTGAINWSKGDKAYVMQQKMGKSYMDVLIKPEDVVSIDIEKPAGWDNAVAQVEKGNGASQEAFFKKVKEDYAHFQWDAAAARYLAGVYLSIGNADKAYAICRDIIGQDASAAYTGELAPVYWATLLKLEKTEKLNAALMKAMASGDRYASGAALIMKGDMILAKGDTTDLNRQALSDGYLRVVLLYTDKEVADKLQPEALYKTARCFEKINQNSRAEAFRGKLKSMYATSPWASK